MISYRKIGGLRFLTVGRLQISFCQLRKGRARRKIVEVRPITDPLAPLNTPGYSTEPNPFGYTPASEPVIWTHL